MHAYMMPTMSKPFHNMQGCVIILHHAWSTPKQRSTSFWHESYTFVFLIFKNFIVLYALNEANPLWINTISSKIIPIIPMAINPNLNSIGVAFQHISNQRTPTKYIWIIISPLGMPKNACKIHNICSHASSNIISLFIYVLWYLHFNGTRHSFHFQCIQWPQTYKTSALVNLHLLYDMWLCGCSQINILKTSSSPFAPSNISNFLY